MNIKVVSWNIWGGKNRDEVINFLKKIEFDVLALQEVTVRPASPARFAEAPARRAGGNIEGATVNDAEVIAKELGYNLSYAKSFTTDRHTPIYDMGNAVISKYPIAKSTTHVLSGLEEYVRDASTEPRNALQCDIAVGEKNSILTVVSTHLGYSPTLQATPLQMQQVTKLLAAVPNTKTLLLGDFNSDPTSQVVTTVLQHFKHTDTHLDQVSWTNFKKEGNPKHRIDYIFASPDVKTILFQIEASSASDHQPLIAEFEV